MKNKIETERLILRPWKFNDIEALCDGLNNFDVAKFLTIPFPYTIEDAKSFINTRIENPNTKQKSYFAIVEKNSEKVIGGTNICLDENNIATGGIWINANYHGHGYGTEAMRGRAAYCFDQLKAVYLINGFLEGNEISYKMQRKLGYKLTGELGERNCPARGGKTKEIKTMLKKEDFIR